MDRFRKQLVLACTTIILVIGLGAATGITALHSSGNAQADARTIDNQIVLIERLRDTTREIAASARRYMASGDREQEQRVSALIDDMRRDADKLDARMTVRDGPALEADLDTYQLAVLDAMSDFQPDPVERLTRFEDRLARVSLPLSARFDDLIAYERARRVELRSASDLGQSAQWTLVLASAIGIMLAIGVCVSVLRRLSAMELHPIGPASAVPALLRQPFDITELLGQALATYRATAASRGLRLRVDDCPATMVLADRDRIREVVHHLLEAAIANGRQSSELVLTIGSDDGGLRIAVIEPGPFDGATNTEPDALSTCRQIVEAHGGRIGHQSSSVARTLWFTLPSEPALLH